LLQQPEGWCEFYGNWYLKDGRGGKEMGRCYKAIEELIGYF
jgi:hypothetical protein